MAQQTITGACHCGKVRIELDVDLAAGTGRCNCSICGKLRAWTAIVKPQAFRLLAGQDDLSSYEWGAKISKRMFCKHCGVHVFGCGHLEQVGGDLLQRQRRDPRPGARRAGHDPDPLLRRPAQQLGVDPAAHGISVAVNFW